MALNDSGWTPIMYHASHCRVECVRRLLQYQPVKDAINTLTTEPDNPASALAAAAQAEAGSPTDRARIVDMLLEAGANVNFKVAREASVLHLARDLEVVSLLLERGADVTAVDDEGWTPLIFHTYVAHTAIVERLLEQPLVIERKDAQATSGDMEGCTALSLVVATEYGSASDRALLIAMLVLAGADLNLGFLQGAGILHRSIEVEMLSLLLRGGSDATAVDEDG